MIQLNGGGRVYTQKVWYVKYQLPFARYNISSPFGDFCSNVHKRFIALWGEDLAVKMVAWGELRESNPQVNNLDPLVRHDYRQSYMNSVSYSKVFD